MNWLKHILVMIALLAAAMPCLHADDHMQHAHDAETADQFCAAHSCVCHSCDAATCTEDLDVELNTVSVTITAAQPSSVIELISFIEQKSARIPDSFPVYTSLISLRTVQLLI